MKGIKGLVKTVRVKEIMEGRDANSFVEGRKGRKNFDTCEFEGVKEEGSEGRGREHLQ